MLWSLMEGQYLPSCLTFHVTLGSKDGKHVQTHFLIMLQGHSWCCSMSRSLLKACEGLEKQKYDGTSLKGFVAKTDGDVCLQLLSAFP